MTFTELRERRIALGLTCAEFAAWIGVPPDDVRLWEHGIGPMPHPFALAVAVAYVELSVEPSGSRVLRRSSETAGARVKTHRTIAYPHD